MAAPAAPVVRGREERNRLVQEYGWLAVVIAGQYARRSARNRRRLEDLVQVAFIALLSAAERWDAARGVPFAYYGALKVRGAVGRYGHQDATVRPPQSSRKHSRCDTMPRPDLCAAPPEVAPGLAADECQRVAAAVDGLPSREQAVVRGLFWEGRDGRELARALGLGKTRLYQLRQAALGRLRRPLARACGYEEASHE